MRSAVVVTLLAFFLAGCTGSSIETSSATFDAATSTPSVGVVASAAVTDETGSLDVSVVTDELAPVDGALVAVVDPPTSLLTNIEGRAVFNALQPGAYTVIASKPGYRAVREEGILAEVAAGEVVEIRFVLNPIPVVTAETAYVQTFPMRGFIACGGYVRPVGDLNRCGQGVNVAGTWYLRDPNNNSTHTYPIDSAQVKELWSEMVWTPANEALGTTMRFWHYAQAECRETGCSYAGTVGGVGGPSPVRWNRLEGEDKNITGALDSAHGEALAYPNQFSVDVWPTAEQVAGQNVGANVMYQQRYELYVSVFYGLAAPDGFTALGG